MTEMPEHRLVARVEEEEAGRAFLVRSPAVGIVDGVPAPGIYLNAMERFLALRILGRSHLVQLPRGVQGRVVERLVDGWNVPVEHNQPLLRLRLGESPDEAVARAGGTATEAEAADRDLITVAAPSEGIFYRKPTPDSPSYVEEGSPVSKGSVLGLVEVMKSFNQIAYGGTGLPEKGVVARILVRDAQEVGFGQPLFLIRPAP
jgi:biotin carboxyl carrier protein